MGRWLYVWLPGLGLAVAIAITLLASGVGQSDAQTGPAVRERAVLPALSGGSGLNHVFPLNPACLRIENLGASAGGPLPFGESPFVLAGTGPGATDLTSFMLEVREGGFLRYTAIGPPSLSLGAGRPGSFEQVAVSIPGQLLSEERFPFDPARPAGFAASLEICGRPSTEPSLQSCDLGWDDYATGEGVFTCGSGERWGGSTAAFWRPAGSGGLERAGVASLGPVGVFTGGVAALVDAADDSRGSTPLVVVGGRQLPSRVGEPTVEIVTTQPVSVERTRLLGRVCATDQGLWDSNVTATFDVGQTASFRILKVVPAYECRFFVTEVPLPQPQRVTVRVVTWKPWTSTTASGVFAGPWVYVVDHDAKTGTFRQELYNPTDQAIDLAKVSADLWILGPSGQPLAYWPALAFAPSIPAGGVVTVEWPAANIRPALAAASEAVPDALIGLIVNQLRAPGIGGPVVGLVVNP